MNVRHAVLLMMCCGVVSFSVGCFSETTSSVGFDEGELLLDDDWGAEVEDAELDAGEGAGFVGTGSTNPVIGATYSFVKKLTQTLAQSSANGMDTSQSQLDVWYDITVEGVQGPDRTCRVTYRKMKYWHSLPGERVVFDSSDVTSKAPAAVRPYLELIDSGFVFRMNAVGQVSELVEVPESLFRGSLRGTAAAEFVWDRIGLVALARSSSKELVAPPLQIRRVALPVPMEISTRYTIKQSGGGIVSLDLLGAVATGRPATTVTLVGKTVNVTLKGGHAFGELVIDTASGLPRRAHWNRYIELGLESLTGNRIEQRKHEVVTILGLETAPVPGAENDTGGESLLTPGSQLQPVPPPLLRPTDSGS